MTHLEKGHIPDPVLARWWGTFHGDSGCSRLHRTPSFQTEMDLSCTRTDQTVGPQNITESEVATNLVPLQPTLTYRECSISHGQGRTCDLYIHIYIPLSGMIENDTQMVSWWDGLFLGLPHDFQNMLFASVLRLSLRIHRRSPWHLPPGKVGKVES